MSVFALAFTVTAGGLRIFTRDFGVDATGRITIAVDNTPFDSPATLLLLVSTTSRAGRFCPCATSSNAASRLRFRILVSAPVDSSWGWRSTIPFGDESSVGLAGGEESSLPSPIGCGCCCRCRARLAPKKTHRLHNFEVNLLCFTCFNVVTDTVAFGACDTLASLGALFFLWLG